MKLLLVLFILATFESFLYSQPVSVDISEDLAFLQKPAVSLPKRAVRVGSGGDINELQLFMKLSIKGYQLFISSQDKPACPFLPTCSQFAGEAISRYGPVLGLIMASDRLQRCNGMGKGYYPIDPGTGRLSDPIERNNLFARDISYLIRNYSLK
ncbi:MAG: membrane protein insertion efficiency factor YidD [Spirochaetota bacterium]